MDGDRIMSLMISQIFLECKLLAAGIKLEKLGVDYEPRADTCVKAFVRLLVATALAQATE